MTTIYRLFYHSYSDKLFEYYLSSLKKVEDKKKFLIKKYKLNPDNFNTYFEVEKIEVL